MNEVKPSDYCELRKIKEKQSLMLNFTSLSLDDIEKIRPYFLYSYNRTCDNTVGGTFMWRDYFSVEYALWNNNLVFKVEIKYHYGVTAFSYPLGENVPSCIKEIENYCKAANIPVLFCTVTEAELQYLKTLYTNTWTHQESNWSDYLYKASDIINLIGRKYHGQKNHLNHFKKTYNYNFEEITNENIAEVREFYSRLSKTLTKDSEIFAEEQAKTFEVLDNYDKYALPGGLIRVDGKVAAFSIGEICNDVLHIHIEKADTTYRGIYQAINNEYARHYATDEVEYINREEDVGDPGLRISKLSYHPVELIDKFIVEVRR